MCEELSARDWASSPATCECSCLLTCHTKLCPATDRAWAPAVRGCTANRIAGRTDQASKVLVNLSVSSCLSSCFGLTSGSCKCRLCTALSQASVLPADAVCTRHGLVTPLLLLARLLMLLDRCVLPCGRWQRRLLLLQGCKCMFQAVANSICPAVTEHALAVCKATTETLNFGKSKLPKRVRLRFVSVLFSGLEVTLFAQSTELTLMCSKLPRKGIWKEMWQCL